ncbi:MAG: hypothetical protein HUJ74_01365 [Lachnospiraceae bacterium]|nr:hypothetical protein [Lachnospiraceae bacterium]
MNGGKGINNVVSDFKYELLFTNINNYATNKVKYLKVFTSNNQMNQVDGVILLGTILTRE